MNAAAAMHTPWVSVGKSIINVRLLLSWDVNSQHDYQKSFMRTMLGEKLVDPSILIL